MMWYNIGVLCKYTTAAAAVVAVVAVAAAADGSRGERIRAHRPTVCALGLHNVAETAGGDVELSMSARYIQLSREYSDTIHNTYNGSNSSNTDGNTKSENIINISILAANRAERTTQFSSISNGNNIQSRTRISDSVYAWHVSVY